MYICLKSSKERIWKGAVTIERVKCKLLEDLGYVKWRKRIRVVDSYNANSFTRID